MRKEVEELLEYAGDDSFLENSPIVSERDSVLSPGNMLGSFQILGLLGSGGMGEVYRARDLRLDRDVAIKILPPAFATDAERTARFEREARATSALNHPNILSIYDVGREGDLSWMVCEFVEGQSLRQALAGGPMRPATAVEIAAQIADGLAVAHSAGVVHRDLKPENVMLTRDERVKILDFGLAQWRPPGGRGRATEISGEAGAILGTPCGMSPEQVLGSPVDHRSDLFSLGTLLFEMLAGKRPFAGKNTVAVMNAIVHAAPEDLPAHVPEAIADVVRRCLEKNPERRFQSAADLAFALRLAGRNFQSLATPRPRRKKAWTTATTAVMLTLAVTAGWLYRSVKPTASAQAGFPGRLRRLTWYEGLTTDAAISPDGRLVAYASDSGREGNLDIFVQQVDGGGTVRLTHDPADDVEPTFTPDGGRVAFESARDGGGIYETPALGGEARLLVAGGRHPRFSPDGQCLLYSVGEPTRFRSSRYSSLGGRLYVRALAGGEPALISKGCTAVLSLGVWSPDSRYVMFSGRCSGRDGVWLGRRDGTGSPQLVDLAMFRSSNGLRSPAGLSPIFDQWLTKPSRLLLPVVDRDTSYEAILPISADGIRAVGPLQRLTFGPDSTAQASASAGGRVVLSVVRQSSNLWRLDIDDVGRAKGTPIQLTAERSMCVNPVLSMDGQHVAFVSIRGSGLLGGDWSSGMAAEYQLRVIRLATGIGTAAARSEQEISNPVFTVDGKVTYLAAPRLDPPGSRRLATFEVGAQGGEEMKILPQETGALTDWSRDGNFCITVKGHLLSHLAISMVDRRTLRELRILEIPDGNLSEAKLSHDGKWITFNAIRNRRSRIYIAPFRAQLTPVSDWIPLTDGATWDDKPRLSVDDKLLFYVSDRDGFRCIWVQRLRANKHPNGAPRAVYHFHSAKRSLAQEAIGYLGLASGRGVLVFNQGETSGEIWLLDPYGNRQRR